jgi:DNA-nicking Smr family endonuclease
MVLAPEDVHCPKCDEHRYAKNRNKTFSVDIAHNMQTVAQAEQQLDNAIRKARDEKFGRLKIIVGRGIIQTEIRRSLDAAQLQNRIRDYRVEENNEGAYLIRMSARD